MHTRLGHRQPDTFPISGNIFLKENWNKTYFSIPIQESNLGPHATVNPSIGPVEYRNNGFEADDLFYSKRGWTNMGRNNARFVDYLKCWVTQWWIILVVQFCYVLTRCYVMAFPVPASVCIILHFYYDMLFFIYNFREQIKKMQTVKHVDLACQTAWGTMDLLNLLCQYFTLGIFVPLSPYCKLFVR